MALLIGAGILILIFFLVAVVYGYFFARKGRSPMFRDFYECVFKAIPDNRVDIDIQFSGLMIIFLVYDMEIIFLAPILVNLGSLTYVTVYVVGLVLAILGISYWYEWDSYILSWGW
jgi:NADH-quinone oxidoreductase subunit A